MALVGDNVSMLEILVVGGVTYKGCRVFDEEKIEVDKLGSKCSFNSKVCCDMCKGEGRQGGRLLSCNCRVMQAHAGHERMPEEIATSIQTLSIHVPFLFIQNFLRSYGGVPNYPSLSVHSLALCLK